mmetsp:Transcript_1561/g.2545  ORF Transcript_1561/g.2545 Transcript_1561/m.2545 type:complete len:260 (-) Transcript_1561:111-890(-)
MICEVDTTLSDASTKLAQERTPSTGPRAHEIILAQITGHEKAALRRLLPQLPAGTDAFLACRFLRGHKGNVTKAAHACLQRSRWRASLKAELAYPEESETALCAIYSPRLLDWCDFFGRPIVYVPLGKLDCSAAASQGVTIEMLIRRHISTLEAIERAVDASANPLAGHLLVHDLHGCTATKFVRSRAFFKEILKIDSTFFPEILGKLICIRAPLMAAWAFSQIKQFLNPVTASKIQICRGMKALEPYVPVDRLAIENI